MRISSEYIGGECQNGIAGLDQGKLLPRTRPTIDIRIVNIVMYIVLCKKFRGGAYNNQLRISCVEESLDGLTYSDRQIRLYM